MPTRLKASRALTTLVGGHDHGLNDNVGLRPSRLEMIEALDDLLKKRSDALARLEMIVALADLGLLVKDRSDDDPLKRMWEGLISTALGYKTEFKLRSPAHKLKEPIGRLLSQGVLARVAVERQRTHGETLEEAASWVARQISSEQAARLMDKPNEFSAVTIIKWRDACWKSGRSMDKFGKKNRRRFGFFSLDDGHPGRACAYPESGDKALLESEVGMKAIIAHAVEKAGISSKAMT
jgi:hypothetical protein